MESDNYGKNDNKNVHNREIERIRNERDLSKRDSNEGFKRYRQTGRSIR